MDSGTQPQKYTEPHNQVDPAARQKFTVKRVSEVVRTEFKNEVVPAYRRLWRAANELVVHSLFYLFLVADVHWVAVGTKTICGACLLFGSYPLQNLFDLADSVLFGVVFIGAIVKVITKFFEIEWT
jgi:hypothetical protein